MGNRPGPDFGKARVRQLSARWRGREVPFLNKNWLAMIWKFNDENYANEKPITGSDPRRLDNLRAFWFSNPNIEDNETENLRWYILRPLGHGSFGQVALWVREDQPTGRAGATPLDFCAVKQFHFKEADQYKGLPSGIVKEGV
jgi:hypothetical protein